MKKLSQKIGSNEPRKLQILVFLRPWGVAPNPTRDQSLDPLAGPCPDPSSPEAGKRVQQPLFPGNRMFRGPYVKGLSRHKSGEVQPHLFHGSLDIRPRSGHAAVCFLRFRMVCWPRKMRSCHLPGILSAPCSISTSLRTLYLLCLWGRRKL